MGIEEIRDLRRNARLGLWGWIFSLQHTVVEVAFEDGQSILCEKNGDTGVWIRHRKFGEQLQVHARYPVKNLSFGMFFDQVKDCESFSESIERSNCQHLSLEIFQALQNGGWIQREPLTLANQDVAIQLRDFNGMLDDKLKYKIGNEVVTSQWMRYSMCWGLKGSLSHLFCPWVVQFHLQKIDV